jgi:tetratricopeptide (TPR) repeat protein
VQPTPRPHPLPVLLALAATLAAGLPARRARGDEPTPMRAEARARYEEGLGHYGAGRYPAAIAALQAAYAIDPRREILFAEAQATRLGGDCPRAMALYERFLATDPPARQVEATQLALNRCRQALAAAPVRPPAEPGPRQPPPGTGLRAPAPPPASRGPWYRDVTGGVLAAGALACAGVATGFLWAAHRADQRARQPGIDYGTFESPRQLAERRMAVGAAALAAGVALGMAASGRYLWLRYSAGPATGGGLALGGRF